MRQPSASFGFAASLASSVAAACSIEPASPTPAWLAGAVAAVCGLCQGKLLIEA